jgi:aminoglycoside 2''-phosphotransferase
MVVEHRGIDLAAIGLEIARVAPALAGAPIVSLGEGMDNFAVIVGQHFVFRFAKHDEAAEGLRREIALLPRLARRLAIPIPNIEYAGEHSVTGVPFVGYGLIRGEPLLRPLYESLSETSREAVAGELAAFLRAIHSFPVEEARDCGVLYIGGRQAYAEDLERARVDVFPLLDLHSQLGVEKRLSAFLDDERNFEYAPVVLHGDVWPEHVLYSRAAGRLAGVIDFCDVSIGDSAYDIGFLAHRLGTEFTRRLLSRYEHGDPARPTEKIECFVLFNAIEDVWIGLERGDDDLVDSALADLRC